LNPAPRPLTLQADPFTTDAYRATTSPNAIEPSFRHPHALFVLTALPSARWLGRWFCRRQRLLEAGYAVVARHRRLLGYLVPDAPGPRRYP
jgi:hypothetical protein